MQEKQYLDNLLYTLKLIEPTTKDRLFEKLKTENLDQKLKRLDFYNLIEFLVKKNKIIEYDGFYFYNDKSSKEMDLLIKKRTIFETNINNFLSSNNRVFYLLKKINFIRFIGVFYTYPIKLFVIADDDLVWLSKEIVEKLTKKKVMCILGSKNLNYDDKSYISALKFITVSSLFAGNNEYRSALGGFYASNLWISDYISNYPMINLNMNFKSRDSKDKTSWRFNFFRMLIKKLNKKYYFKVLDEDEKEAKVGNRPDLISIDRFVSFKIHSSGDIDYK